MASTSPTADQIANAAARLAFGGPVVNNVHRGLIAEVIVEHALMPGWKRPDGDWASFDLHDGKFGLEIKQSAARQTWRPSAGQQQNTRPPRFDIAPRTGRYDQSGKWHDGRGRAAAIYVFAWHGVNDAACDQRDPLQWAFAVVPASRLPPTQKSLSWPAAVALAPAGVVDWLGITAAVAQCRAALADG
jgi:hypothetical protein